MPTIALGHVPNMASTPQDNSNRRETKTERKGFLLRPSITSLLETASKRDKLSENDFVARAVEKEGKKLPLLGDIPCGPLGELQDQDVEAWINVGDLYKVREGDFLLTARGTSMTGDGIQSGDLVIMRSQTTCDDGEIAAVLIDTPLGTQATLKKVRFTPGSSVVKLYPMSDAHEPIEIDTKEHALRVCGVKRGIIRMN